MGWRNVFSVCIVASALSACQSSTPQAQERVPVSLPSPTTIQIVPTDCEEGLRAVVEATLIKDLRVRVSPDKPDFRMTLSCHWEMSGPGTTSFYSSWGNADLTFRLERVSDGTTVLADSFTEGGKSRALAMKKASEDLVLALQTRLRTGRDK